MVKGFAKNSTHVLTRAAPLQPNHVRAICEFLDQSRAAPLAAKPAVLIGYASFLHASNLLSPSMQQWGGPHTLLAADISTTSDGLTIAIRSTKTRSAPTGLYFSIPRGPVHELCPVRAWTTYRRIVRPWALGPAFVHLNRLPLTPAQVVKLMRLALRDFTDIIPQQVSMHSLCRGGTQAAIDQGVPLDTVQARGTWSSPSGMRPYLAP